MKKNKIQKELNEKCSGCGLCESICPRNAIEVTEKDGFLRPQVNSNCVACGKCKNSCPNKIDSDVVTYSMFEYKLYGHSKNDIVRKNAASGALTTELLKYLLDTQTIDYVVVADIYKNDRNLGFVIIDRQNAELLYKHSGSNYCPANIGRAIKKIRDISGKYAIVCLPCLARGIDKLRKSDPIIKERVKFVITLLCNHVPSYEATEYLIKKYRIDSPKLIKYRGDGWFGCFRTFDQIDSYNASFSVPFSEYFSTSFSTCFWQNACINCKDHFGITADASMGDADFVKYRDKNTNDGETIIFSNNRELIQIIDDMKKDGIISISDDISVMELEQIYGALSNLRRASRRNLKTGVDKVLREDCRKSVLNTSIRKIIELKKAFLE